jgi:hypothetical protein
VVDGDQVRTGRSSAIGDRFAVSDLHPFACLSVVRGTGTPRELQLFRGTEVEPFSIGRRGTWAISHGAATAEIDGFFYFDGTQLFVQSVPGGAPIEVGATPIGQDWMAIDRPCDIKLAAIRLRFEFTNADEADERTNVFTPSLHPPPKPLTTGALLKPGTHVKPGTHLKPGTQASSRAPSPRSTASDSDATQLLSQHNAGVVIRSAPGGAAPQAQASVAPTQLRDLRSVAPLALADMRLEQERLSEGGLTVARPLAAPPRTPLERVPARPAFAGYRATDDEVTAYGPLNSNVHQAAAGNIGHASTGGSLGPQGPHGVPNMDGVNAIPPGFSQPSGAGVAYGPSNAALPQGAPHDPAVASPSKLTGFAWWKAEWQRTSIPKRVILCLSPAMLLLVPSLFTSNDNRGTTGVQGSATAASSSATGAPTAAPLLATDNAGSGFTAPVASTSASSAASAATSPSIPAVGSPSTSGVPSHTPGMTTARTGPPGSVVPKGAEPKSLERQAVDAVAENRLAEAARLYQQLAQQHPERPAFAQAALILSAKAAAKPQ